MMEAIKQVISKRFDQISNGDDVSPVIRLENHEGQKGLLTLVTQELERHYHSDHHYSKEQVAECIRGLSPEERATLRLNLLN